jgi:hypothetical protein
MSKTRTEPGGKATSAMSFIFVFPAFERLQMARCHAALVSCLHFSQSTIVSSGLRRHKLCRGASVAWRARVSGAKAKAARPNRAQWCKANRSPHSK